MLGDGNRTRRTLAAPRADRVILFPLLLITVLLAACGDDGETDRAPVATAVPPTHTATALFTPRDTPTTIPSATATSTDTPAPTSTPTEPPTATATFTATEPPSSPAATPTLAPTQTATATEVPVCAPRDEAEVPATFQIRPGVEGVTVTGAPPFTQLNLYDATGRALIGLITDELGQAHFAYIPDEFLVVETGPGTEIPTADGTSLQRGSCYVIRNVEADPVETSEPFSVLGVDDVPPLAFYEGKELVEDWQNLAVTGQFTYIEMRDGVKLSAMVRFPDRALFGPGPYPTVIEYSGYGPSNPGRQEPGSTIVNMALGYATVGVNMRGSGCSGGVFDIFNPAQQADGYDIVETVARQPWVLNHKVGMVGLSYAGISQLYVAQTRPPSLAAITPLSVIEDPWRQQWPGGIYNSGFTKQWLEGRDRDNAPGGSSWVSARIESGDTDCEAHQRLRLQNPDFEQAGRLLVYYNRSLDARRLRRLVPKIEVPVFLTGAWQDEQTGSLFANMLGDFVSTERKKFLLFNGHHPDGYGPGALSRWIEFLDFYIARRIPLRLPGILETVVRPLLADQVFRVNFNAPGVPIEPDRFSDLASNQYDEALARYEAEPAVRVLFEVGAGNQELLGVAVPTTEASFASWPPPSSAPRMWFLDADNTLSDTLPATAAVDSYRHDPEAGATTYSGEGALDFQDRRIDYDWPPTAPGLGLSYLTAPLDEDVVVVGTGGYVTLWLASEADDVHVEVTLTDVYPDGAETIVQSGVLRLGHRRIDEELSSTFLIDYTYLREDFRPLTPGVFEEFKVPLRPFSHIFHAGSRLRLLITSPGRESPLWAYEPPDYGGRTVSHQVAHTPEMPSFLLLPSVSGVEVPAEFPPCRGTEPDSFVPSLRGQICRQFVPLENSTVQ